MVKYTVFANFYIDTEERFLRLQHSFFSFYKSNIKDWCINIRGEYKFKVKKFLEDHITTDLNIFLLESKQGWNFDTLNISKYFKTNIIFFWIEDHICVDEISKINSVVSEIKLKKIDHLIYSFFHKGVFIKPLNTIDYKINKNIFFFKYDLKNYKKIKTWYLKKKIKPNYLISACSFMSLELFKKNLNLSKNKKKYNQMLPFNFEQRFDENKILPFNNGVLKKELFVSIDDNHGEKGYCLIDRGLYPNRISKRKLDELRSKKINIFQKTFFLKIIVKRFLKYIFK